MPIVGTAGHVDHGKSTLVHALTGRDPDRWAEEKERGLTIDLGFAWTQIDGIDVGFVDVPGHERFIKNMLAGVGAIDCALLVVAADSGWMPQTEEHAAVLDLLNTTIGVIALTRIDLVDEDTVELATLEIMEEIEGTVLEGWPVVPVSPVSGQGMEDLRRELAAALAAGGERSDGPLKMWVDRSFTVSGAGVVVTGTIAHGTVAVGDDVVLLPQKVHDTVRGLHHHDQSTDHSTAGSRTALNLQSTKLDSVRRGTLVSTPGSFGSSDRLVATLTPARSFDEIPNRGAFHFHIGTAHTPATIRQFRGSGAYRISLGQALPVAMGDRFILRDSGRQAVVGGGRVLEPASSGSLTERQISLLVDAIDRGRDDRATALLAVRGSAEVRDLSMASGGGSSTEGLLAGSTMLSQGVVDRTLARTGEITSEYHTLHPLRPGVPKAELATQVGTSLEIIDTVIAYSSNFREEDGFVRQAGFVNELTPDQIQRWSDVKASIEQSFDVPRMSAIDLDLEVLHSLLRSGALIPITPDLVFTSGQIEEVHVRLAELPEGFSVSQFKVEFGMTRRQAVPVLEWLDKTGWTRRSGDGRTVRRQL
jgi:selenocysteine-specific elongation factor